MGPVIIAENVGAIRSVDSGEESGSCGDASGAASAPDDAAKWRACSNVARPDGVAAVEEAIAELDGGRIEAAKAPPAGIRGGCEVTCHARDEHGVGGT